MKYNICERKFQQWFPSSGMSGLLFTVLIAILIFSLFGCARSQKQSTVDPGTVRQALAGNDQLDAQVIRAGEQAIPLIFHELERKPNDVLFRYKAVKIVREMSMEGTVAPSATAIRRVLLDVNRPTNVRTAAATMLYWFKDSGEVKEALKSTIPTDFRPNYGPSELKNPVAATSYSVLQAWELAPNGLDEEMVKVVMIDFLNDYKTVLILEGDKAVRMVLDELKKQPGNQLAQVNAFHLIILLGKTGSTDPRAPYLIKNLQDEQVDERVCKVIAESLRGFPGLPAVSERK